MARRKRRVQRKRWTQEEDEMLTRYMNARPHQPGFCYMAVAEATGRTKEAVSQHWSKLGKNPDTPFCYGVVSSRGTTKNGRYGEGTPISSSLFARIKRLLGF